jgi:acetyltransferase-like isoleucine patch superfamily enzyme
MDYFQTVEHELITVCDHVVFGHFVSLCPEGPNHVRECITVSKEANVLDTTLIEGGTTIGEGALIGSASYIPRGHQVAPHSIHTGNRGGAAVVLRAGQTAKPKESALEALSRTRHESTWWWLLFNAYCIVCSLIFGPLPYIMDYLTVYAVAETYITLYPCDGGSNLFTCLQAADTLLDGVQDLLNALFLFPLFALAAFAIHTLAIVLFKWLIVGTYREGDYPFYGKYHFQWVLMMVLYRGAAARVWELVAGTGFMPTIYRMFGAKVGRNCCIFKSHMEYDIFELGDCSTVGRYVSHQCHTVERMVIKLAPFIVGRGCTLRNNSVVMPGTSLEDNSTLLEKSQILKGLTINEGHTWAGLPGARVHTASENVVYGTERI